MSTTTKKTVSEMIESLTGYEEIGISKAFDSEIFSLLDRSPITAGRALVFVEKLREGLGHAEAKDAALKLTLKEVDAYFDEDEDEVMPEEPVTEAGKEPALDG